MESYQLKPSARCPYSSTCQIYSNDVLPLNSEMSMCGRGQESDENYKPEIPHPPEFNPVENYEFEPGGTCDAFVGYEDAGLIREIRKQIDGVRKLMEEQGY